MDVSSDPLILLLSQCVVQIETDTGDGSGFFVSPGTILTCAHVVEEAQETGGSIRVHHNGNTYPATLLKYQAKPFPDLALLSIQFENHNCVFLDPQVQLRDALFGFGYSEEYPGGEGIHGRYESPSWFDHARTQKIIKFTQAEVVPGFSGGPLLNLRTGAVCGVIKRTRGEGTNLGGRAVPIDYAIGLFDIKSYQDDKWLEARSQQAVRNSQISVQTSKQDILIYEHPNNQYASANLFGRDEIIQRVNDWLDQNQRVLLYGLAASGKTVLAATIAERRFLEGKGKYLWLRLKAMKEDDVLDSLIRRFTTEKDRQQLSELARDSKIQILSSLIERSDAKLWVIDDAMEGSALNLILQVAPTSMGVLITSRINYGTGKNLNRVLEVGDIAPEAALEMLVGLSGRSDLRRNPSSMELLRTLGFHPYSIEIASRQLSQPEKDVDELLEMIEGAPFDLEMPGDFAEQDRESMKKLLDAVVASLKAPSGDVDKDQANQAVLRVFHAFGAFFASGATVDLLSAYLHQKNGETIRTLNEMAEISLVRPEAGTRFYDIHDLVFSYARSLWESGSGGDYSTSLTILTDFLETHQQDFKLLASEMDNLLGGARQAKNDHPDIFLQIISALARGGYMDNRGHTVDLIRLLDEAIAIAQAKQLTELLHYLLSKRGNAHYDRLELAEAAGCYLEALTLAPNWFRKMVLEAVLGKTYTRLKDYIRADEYFWQSKVTVEKHNNTQERDEYLAGRIFILGQENEAAYFRKDYQLAKSLILEGLTLTHESNNPLQENMFKINLGTQELLLGAKAALDIHKQVYDFAEGFGNQGLLATAYFGMAIDYLVIDEFEQARDCLLKAKKIYEEYGDLKNLNQLKALAQIFKEG